MNYKNNKIQKKRSDGYDHIRCIPHYNTNSHSCTLGSSIMPWLYMERRWRRVMPICVVDNDELLKLIKHELSQIEDKEVKEIIMKRCRENPDVAIDIAKVLNIVDKLQGQRKI